jgi:hypothetical protein
MRLPLNARALGDDIMKPKRRGLPAALALTVLAASSLSAPVAATSLTLAPSVAPATAIPVATRSCRTYTYACGQYACGLTTAQTCTQNMGCLRETRWCTKYCTRTVCN